MQAAKMEYSRGGRFKYFIKLIIPEWFYFLVISAVLCIGGCAAPKPMGPDSEPKIKPEIFKCVGGNPCDARIRLDGATPESARGIVETALRRVGYSFVPFVETENGFIVKTGWGQYQWDVIKPLVFRIALILDVKTNREPVNMSLQYAVACAGRMEADWRYDLCSDDLRLYVDQFLQDLSDTLSVELTNQR